MSNVILQGLKEGVDRHWRYTKNFLKVKPEYLLTVSVADKISNCGFNQTSGFELSVQLEHTTGRIIGDIWEKNLEFKNLMKPDLKWGRHHHSLFKPTVKWPTRRGKVDIYIQNEYCDESYIVELKNFNPSNRGIKEDLQRLKEFLDITPKTSPLKSCFLAFPSTEDKQKSLNRCAQEYGSSNFCISTEIQYEITGEDPEHGIPAYYCNIVIMTRYF
ncbi:hypothetical protein VZH09_13910 (plasmid) [Synechococcus elongatus IITB7]|uniref:hypothetical protein n=1 Tax=Synechococcus elongatus TaxID=32046 RepID=UPI0030D1C21C